jgi:RimJ/RimL family protein N-acetyltransferase
MNTTAIESCKVVHTGTFTTLRPLQPHDAELTLTWRLSERANLLNRGATTVAEQERWIISRPAQELNFIIETKSSLPVGMISLVGINLVHRHAEPARFLIADEEAVRGLPIAVEAMKLLYHVAFDQLELVRVHGLVAQENGLMLKWQTYLGMKEEGVLRQHYYLNGRFQDAIAVGLLRCEFEEITLPRMNNLIAMSEKITPQSEGVLT